jgi:hypothetical protein
LAKLYKSNIVVKKRVLSYRLKLKISTNSSRGPFTSPAFDLDDGFACYFSRWTCGRHEACARS